MKVGVLTGGGDCPGLNAVIRAVVRAAYQKKWEVVGFRHGWKGIVKNEQMKLDLSAVSGVLPRGGTILGTSRTNPYKDPKMLESLKQTFKDEKLDALVAIGGEDTLGVANKLAQEGLPVVGVPKTIDNDLNATDYTFGFDTAVNIATECIDRLHTTAESHDRVMVTEIMGRHAGWITLHAGLAGGADFILLPEFAVSVDEVCDVIRKRHQRGKTFSIVAVSEGAKVEGLGEVLQTQEKDAFGHVRLGGIGQTLSKIIEEKTGFETRYTVLGHIQRGGSPTAFDRVLGTRFGVKAIELVEQKKWGYMVSLKGVDITSVKIQDAVGQLKVVSKELYDMARIFFG